METINIYGDKCLETPTKARIACRGVILSEGKILLTYETETKQWFIPGGGLEEHESLEECCSRELAEETGYTTTPLLQYLTNQEHYDEWLFISHHFVCRITGQTRDS